jgi:SH3-like domain-containing protein
MLDLYTLICDYRGGTYIAQLSANSPQGAVLFWLKTGHARKYVPKEARSRIAAEVKNRLPISIAGCKNVWCHTTSARGGLVLINLVLTHPRGSRNHSDL